MTADLTMDLYGAQIAYNYREVPWHKEGTPMQDDVSVPDAVRIARAVDPIYLAKPAGLFIPDIMWHVPVENIESMDKALSVVRVTPAGQVKVLGTASERFYIMQNLDLAELVEPLRQFGRVETVGSLADGAKFFITFLGDVWSVNGDKQQAYLAVRNTHLPGAALEIMLVFVRIVCVNTWYAAEGTASWKLPLAHTQDLPMFVKWVVKVLEELPGKQKQVEEETRRLMDTSIANIEVRALYDKALTTPNQQRVRKAIDEIRADGELPLPLKAMAFQIEDVIKRKDDNHRQAVARIDGVKNAAYNNYLTSETAGKMGTMWRAFNAFTEAVDWNVRPGKNAVLPKTAASNWWGERAGWKQAKYTADIEFAKDPEKILA